MYEEPQQEARAQRQEEDHQFGVFASLQDAEHECEHADRRKDRARDVEPSRRVGGDRVDD